MSSQDLKRSYTDMKSTNNNSSGGATAQFNGGTVNGTITTRNQQQQQQHAQTQAQQQRIQQQQKQSLMSGNAHGYAFNANMQKKVYNFSESAEELLKKHANVAPSMEFHIHENHYRFGSQDGIISKNNQLVKDFLEYVARGEIPHATVEVLRDAGIKFYEGCLILKVFDHRNFIEVDSKRVPRSFRTILRPTQLSLFYDLLYQSDSALQRFSDTLATSMETEILMLTHRNLNLKTPLNPYKATPYTKPIQEYPIVKETGEILHNHRVECTDPRSKAFHPFKELHEELPQQNSEYEQFMLAMNDKNIMGDSSEASQFTRLRFVEQLRLNKEKMKQVSMNANLSNRSPMGTGTPNITNLTPQQQQMLQQRRLQQMQIQQMQGKGGNLTPLQQQQQLQVQQQKALAQQQLQQNSPMVESVAEEDKKPKKKKNPAPRKPPAPKAVAGKTVPGSGYADKTLPGGELQEAPKKKRGSYKKKPKTEPASK